MTSQTVAPAFTRQHYRAIAAVLADLRDRFDDGGACQFGVECAADDLAAMFAAHNPRFDNERFRTACGVMGE